MIPIAVMQGYICMYVFIDVCVGVNCIELLRMQTIVAKIQVTHVFVNT